MENLIQKQNLKDKGDKSMKNSEVNLKLQELGLTPITEEPFNRELDGRHILAGFMRAVKQGFDDYLANIKGYQYSFAMLTNSKKKGQLNRTGKRYKDDKGCFESKYYNSNLVYEMLKDYKEKLNISIEEEQHYLDSNGEYVELCMGKKFYVDNYGEVIKQVDAIINELAKYSMVDYEASIEVVKNFNKIVAKYKCKLPVYTELCPAFVEAYKAVGAYYSALNLVKWHGVKITNGYSTQQNVATIEEMANTLKGNDFFNWVLSWSEDYILNFNGTYNQ